MATYSNFTVWLFDNALNPLGSTTNIISARYKCGIDTAGEGEFVIPLVDTPILQYIVKYNVATFTCQIDGEQCCFGEIVIDRSNEVFVPNGPDLLHVRGKGRLTRLELDRATHQVISDGASGPGSSAITDALALSQYTWSVTGTSFGSSYGNPPAYVVTANENVLEILNQVLLQNSHHFADLPGSSGLSGGDESVPENRVWVLQEMDQLSDSVSGFSGPHFKDDADESSIYELPILSIEKILEEKEIATKAIVHGGGLGSGTFTIEAASGTKTAPSGYSYDFVNSIITNTALEAVTNQPGKTKIANISNIKPEDPADATSVLSAAEQLVDAGQLWIEERIGNYDEYYRIGTVCKITDLGADRPPAPGAQLGARLTLSKDSPYNTSGGLSQTNIISIDKVMHILEAEWSVQAGDGELNNKLLGTFLLGPAPRQERGYSELVTDEIKELKRRLDHADAQAGTSTPPSGTTYVTTDQPLLTAVASSALANERAGTNGNGTVFTDNGAGTTFQTDIRTPLSVGSGSTNSGGNSSTGHSHASNLSATDLPNHVLATTAGLGSQHTVSGLTSGMVLRATGATTAAFGVLQHSQLGGVTADQHHSQVHVLATTSGLGADHTVSGLTARQVLIATGATTALFRSLVAADLPTGSTLSVSSTNSGTSHAITTSSAVTSATAVILATDGDGYLQIRRLGVGITPGTNLHAYDNSSATEELFIIEQDGTGDAALRFTLSGVISWRMGADNTDGDSFKIAKGPSSFGTNDYFAIDTSGNITMSETVGIGKAPEASIQTVIYKDDTSTEPVLKLEQDGTGDAALRFTLTGVQSWTAGIDNSDSDRFKFSRSGTLGTTDVMALGNGVVVGSPTGGDKGSGTINAQAVYDDNVLLTDYVFEPQYPLLTIDAMTAFYQTRKHLPTIPGRDDWESSGKFSLGKLANHLWETIEVQAIYITQLHQRIRVFEESL
ncbi:MAG: hypothetical protein KDK05_13280 [Candidatus Competibacteraceae bacterium]|nr:hypothetical protein [Candidatus Competibacteraceae bacterium]